MLGVAVNRFSFEDNAIRHVCRVCGLDDVMFAHTARQKRRYIRAYTASDSPEAAARAKSDIAYTIALLVD